jgi:hypothetical protein
MSSEDTATLTYLEGDFIKITHGTKLVARAHKVQGGAWHGLDRRPGVEVERPEFTDEEAAKAWVTGVYLRFCLSQMLSV